MSIKKSRRYKFKRQRAYWMGQMAEFYVAGYLRLKGYRILARQYRKPVGEIDIIARKKNTLIAVEVKFRKDDIPLESLVSSKQRRRIGRCLEAYRQENVKYQNHDMQCDLIKLTNFYSRPDHFQNAW